MQSALAPAGAEAAEIARLTWALVAGAAVIWCAVILLAAYAVWGRHRAASGGEKPAGGSSGAAAARDARRARRLILGGGVVFPVVTLAALLVYGLRITPSLLAADAELVIEVIGEQWWWRVRYLPSGREAVEAANEIRLPAGRRTAFRVGAADVIHSFWIPVLGGKIDMIPGRTNQLAVEPLAEGVYRGVCAEFCGMSHARMAFDVVVMGEESFDEWLRREAQDGEPPATPAAERGQRLFLDNGCGACHRIRGTPAIGMVGPDLTHLGSRLSIGAATLPLGEGALADWIGRPWAFKPGVEMPSYHMLPGADLAAIAAYLGGLE